jgi:hypothetical protein
MERPQGIDQAVAALWLTVALSAIASLINKWLGHIHMNDFMLAIIVYSLACIIPYKIGRRSNAARYVYLIFSIAGFLLMSAGGTGDMPKLDLLLSYLLIPVQLFILYRLFDRQASLWFQIPVS